METNKVIASAEEEWADKVYLIHHTSDSDPYGIHTITGWSNNTHTRFVVVYRGYYEDYEHHGHCYEEAYDDFTKAFNRFKEIADKMDKTEYCEHFERDYGIMYDDGEPYIRSASAGDYSPSSPWNAPGMSVNDFI